MKITVSHSSLLPLSASVLALALALAAQFGLGWRPCELCLLQRIPVAAAGIAAAASLYPARNKAAHDALTVVAALLFLGTAVLAAYHVGVEQHWWLYGGGCSRDPDAAMGPVDFAQAMSQPVVVRCDQPPFQWHGVTMAGLNVVYCAVVGIATLRFMVRERSIGNGR